MQTIDQGAMLPSARPAGGKLAALAGSAGVVMLAGMIAGVVWGVGARAAMRVIALAAHQLPEFSLGGTLMIVLLGAAIGIPASLLFLAVRVIVHGPAWRQGLVFGGVVLLTLGSLLAVSVFREEADGLGVAPLAAGLFGALFVLFGLLVGLLVGPIERRVLGGRPAGSLSLARWLILATPVVYMVAIVVLMQVASTE
jgi:hypothetical protein